MTSTTDFNEWLNSIEDRDIEQINDLYESILGKTEMGFFSTDANNNQLFVTEGGNDLVLRLVSEDAVKAFLKKLDVEFGGDYGNVQSHWSFVREMRKGD